ncbi:MAG: rhodanese-related sulfurtransferase [Patulibacter sp.]
MLGSDLRGDWSASIHGVALPKILLFYVFTPLADPEAIRVWQHDLCRSLGLRGRILISSHGINATVGGELDAVKRYARSLRAYPPFHDADLKWSAGSGLTDTRGASGWRESVDFPKLSVKVRPEIVTFGVPDELVVDEHGVVGGGQRLDPEALHQLLDERGDDVVFIDGRNAYEAQIGRFDGALVPDISTTAGFVEQLDAGHFDELKDKPVVTYCTGGIRCEVLTALMKNRGFGEVYQLDGGIVRYGERYGDRGHWSGSLYVFDRRMKVDFSATPDVIAHCAACGTPTSRMQNCDDLSCRRQLVICDECATAGRGRCPAHPA